MRIRSNQPSPYSIMIYLLLLLLPTQFSAEGFRAGTLVATPTGSCRIEIVMPGDRVISRTPAGDAAESVITAVSQKLTMNVHKLVVAGESILLDKTQRVYLANKQEWCTVESLSPGDMLISSDNHLVQIEDIQKGDNSLTILYQLSVFPHHNFCVGQSRLVVHNAAAEFTAAKAATDAAIAIASGIGITMSLPVACASAGAGAICYGVYSLIEHLRNKNKPQAPPADQSSNNKKSNQTLQPQVRVRGFDFTDEELRSLWRQELEGNEPTYAPCLPEINPTIVPKGSCTIQQNQPEKEIVHAPVTLPAALDPEQVPRCGLQGQTLPTFDASDETNSGDSASSGEQTEALPTPNESPSAQRQVPQQSSSEIDKPAASQESAHKESINTTESAAINKPGYEVDSYTPAQLDEAIDAIDNTVQVATHPVNELADLSDVLAKEEGRGNSKGRINPENLEEKLAMNEVMSNPNGIRLESVVMTDKRWPTTEGWVKKTQKVDLALSGDNKIDIHYVHNEALNLYDDFKFKD